jgi:hypothetical protein
VDLTAIGDGEVQVMTPEVAGQGQYNLTSDTLSLP